LTNPSFDRPSRHSVHGALLALAAALLAAAPPSAAASPPSPADPDFIAIGLEVNQSIQAGTTPLVGGRATFVRTSVGVTNPPATTAMIDGLLRVYVNGIEAPGSPYFSDNGPFPASGHASAASENGTLNFIFLAPTASNVTLQVEINPPGPNHVLETNPSNNTVTTAALSFGVQKVAEQCYVPIDYRPSGGSIPNLPDPFLIEPGMGDNFIQGIYPSSDWHYHRSDAPSKLWTSSLASSGSPLLDSLFVDINLMSPKPDLIYGFIPGGLPYNGQSVIGGNVGMGNTETFRYQRTIAHEMGHDFGLQHNTITVGLVGIDVERHLHLTENLPLIKPATLKDIMYAGLFTSEAWVWEPNYVFFYNHFIFNPTDADQADTASDAPTLVITGLWNNATGVLELRDVLAVPGGRLTPPAQPGMQDLVVRAFAGGRLVRELPITARGCDEAFGAQAPVVAFTAVLPAPGPGEAAFDRLVVAQAGTQLAQPLQRLASAHAPEATFVAPVGGNLPDSRITVAWTATDPDGDALHSYLRYSPDGGKRFVPLATGTDATSLEVDLRRLPALTAGRAFFELLVSDGFHTTSLRTAGLGAKPGSVYGGAIGATVGGNPPWVEIVAPDSSTTWREGATIVLHSSGWDLEDNALSGASIQWTDDVDGPLGQGRLLTTSSLSPGTHHVTVTATDSDLMQTSDMATITVTPRGLPDTGGNTCQADLGFGGPGSSVLSVCGGDLSTGTTADLSLTGAPPSVPALLFVSFNSNPTPFKGGLLVPLPELLLVPFMTTAGGQVTINNIPGGNGPASLYLQFALTDAGAPQGVGLSNVVRVDLLP